MDLSEIKKMKEFIDLALLYRNTFFVQTIYAVEGEIPYISNLKMKTYIYEI